MKTQPGTRLACEDSQAEGQVAPRAAPVSILTGFQAPAG